MRKYFYSIIPVIILFFSSQIYGQESKGKIVLSANLGIGGSYGSEKLKTPSFNGSFEYFLSNSVSIGALLGYSTVVISPEYGNPDENVGGLNVGPLVSFYFLNKEKFNLYAGTLIGYHSHKFSFNNYPNNFDKLQGFHFCILNNINNYNFQI